MTYWIGSRGLLLLSAARFAPPLRAAALRRRSTSQAWVAAARISQRAEPRRAGEFLLRAWRASHGPHLLAWACALRLYALIAGK